jgi:hypothetical protein
VAPATYVLLFTYCTTPRRAWSVERPCSPVIARSALAYAAPSAAVAASRLSSRASASLSEGVANAQVHLLGLDNAPRRSERANVCPAWCRAGGRALTVRAGVRQWPIQGQLQSQRLSEQLKGSSTEQSGSSYLAFDRRPGGAPLLTRHRPVCARLRRAQRRCGRLQAIVARLLE